MKQVNLPLEVAKTMYNGSDKSLKDFALANYTKEELEVKELPKTWKELKYTEGYYPDYIHSRSIKEKHNILCSDNNTTLFATKEQAEASIALARLSQLMQVYNDGWIPNWEDRSNKWSIHSYKGIIDTTVNISSSCFLAFKDVKIRNLFFENFRDLIKQAKPLL